MPELRPFDHVEKGAERVALAATPEDPEGTIGRREQYSPAGPFAVRDCALAAIATGRHAENLRELRNELRTVDPASIYYHFWGGLLRPTFDDPRYNNDFARWAHHALHNPALAERLSVVDPTDHNDLDSLRRELVDTIEEELDSSDALAWTSRGQRFHFVRSQIVVFDTRRSVKEPAGLAAAVATMSRSSVFYHFVDARRRTPNSVDDFSTWLTDLGDEEYCDLCVRLKGIDPFFITLTEIGEELVQTFKEFLGEGTP